MHHVINRVGMTLGLVVTALAGAYSGPVAAEDKYPSRPIEFVVPWGPGGGADQLARLTGKLLEPVVGTSLPVINVPAPRAAPAWPSCCRRRRTATRWRSTSPTATHCWRERTHAGSRKTSSPSPSCCRGHPSFSCRKIARSRPGPISRRPQRKNPGTLKVATLGFAASTTSRSSISRAQGIKVIQVPFSKPSERYVSILGGHADALYEQAGDVAQFLNGKQMRPLILFGKERHPAFKDIPAPSSSDSKDALRSLA